MGYVVRAKKPVIDERTAEQVRWMFQRYLELGCLSALQRELDARGIRSARRRRTDGHSIGNSPIGRGALAHILRNRFYLGEVAYKGRIYRGEQPALIERAVFEAVQVLLDRNAVERRNERLEGQALLTGLLFDTRGNAMSPSHANKQGCATATMSHRRSSKDASRRLEPSLGCARQTSRSGSWPS